MHLKIIITLRLSNHKLRSRVGLSVMLSSNIDQIE